MSDDLKDLEQKFIQAGEYGTHLQKEGVKITRVAAEGLETVNVIKLKKDPGDAAAEAWVAGANATIPSFHPDNLWEIKSYYLAVGTSAAAGMTIFFDNYLKQKYGLTDEELRELDSYLEDFSREFEGIGALAKMRKGSWDIFYSATDITLMSASHAMRELLTKIISQLASNAKMEEAKAASPEGEDKKISKKDRIKLLLSGPGSKGKAAQEMVDMATNKCYEAFTRLQEIAHGSAGLREEVEQNMRITEHALLSILRFWKLRFKSS